MNIQELQARVDKLNEKFRSYDGGDRPMSPPAKLMRELFDAEKELSEARLAEKRGPLPKVHPREVATREAAIEASDWFHPWRAKHNLTPSEAMMILAELQRDLARMCVATERRKANGE